MTTFQLINGQVTPPNGFELSNAEQVAQLPWGGNAYTDNKLFDLVNGFTLGVNNKEQQKRALYLMGLHGMGITDEDLQEYIDIAQEGQPSEIL